MHYSSEIWYAQWSVYYILRDKGRILNVVWTDTATDDIYLVCRGKHNVMTLKQGVLYQPFVFFPSPRSHYSSCSTSGVEHFISLSPGNTVHVQSLSTWELDPRSNSHTHTPWENTTIGQTHTQVQAFTYTHVHARAHTHTNTSTRKHKGLYDWLITSSAKKVTDTMYYITKLPDNNIFLFIFLKNKWSSLSVPADTKSTPWSVRCKLS